MNGIVVISSSSRQEKSIVYFMVIFSGTKLLILPGPVSEADMCKIIDHAVVPV